MPGPFELKPLSPAAIPAALARAERYRLLNEPEQSQSICEDVLRAAPDHHGALVMLILALSDDFPRALGRTASRARDLVARLPTEYERRYYAGLVAERHARALLDLPGPGARAAGEELREAMAHYERAETLRPPDNDDARLRWNACARVLYAQPVLLEQEEAAPPVTNE
jgi:hypothetical protein